MSIYADTSFFVSLYLPDRHSPEAHRRIASRPQVWLTPLHRAEWAHAIAQHVFRKEMSAVETRKVQRDMERDRKAGLWVELDLPDSAWELCEQLAARHGARLGVRTLDSLHVACAIQLGAQAFWTFDDRQAKLAIAEKLST